MCNALRKLSGRQSSLLVIAASLMALTGCGGGGSDPDPASTPSATLTMGKVALLITDAPTDAFCQILASVRRVDLLGAGSPTTVFEGPMTIDLLRLRNYTDFFAINGEVPIGTYSKVRLTLDDLALVECDAAGNPEPASGWEHPHLPGNGKLDLNPRGSFQVIGGETLVIRFDLDMNKSLHLHQTGNGKWQFRPVIFCDIRPAHDKLVRVFGAVRNVNGLRFELCPLRPVAAPPGGTPPPSAVCLDVFTDDKTGIFDETGTRVGTDAITSGDLLTATGFITLFDNDDADTRIDDLRLDAVVVEMGPVGTFKHILGRVVSAPGNNDLFVFSPLLVPTPTSGTTSGIDVRLQAGTRIFAFITNTELTAAALQPGTIGQVNGVFTLPASSGEPLKSSLIVLEPNTTPAVALYSAVIQSPIPADDDTVPATRRLGVNTATLTNKCVKTDASTRYLLITETPDTSETTQITFADLAAGNTVDVFGADDVMETACVLADTIQKYATP
jgi:hypothetical protein